MNARTITALLGLALQIGSATPAPVQSSADLSVREYELQSFAGVSRAIADRCVLTYPMLKGTFDENIASLASKTRAVMDALLETEHFRALANAQVPKEFIRNSTRNSESIRSSSAEVSEAQCQQAARDMAMGDEQLRGLLTQILERHLVESLNRGTVKYFDKWVYSWKLPSAELPETEAAIRHARGQAYVAMATTVDAGRCMVELTSARIAVHFLDDLNRRWREYEFTRQASGKLFLSASIHRDFAGNSDDVLKSTTLRFKADGTISSLETDHQASTEQERVEHADPAANWEAWPTFGNYASLCRVERTL